MRYIFTFSILFILAIALCGQNKNTQIYDPNTDAKQQINTAVDQAGLEKKHIMIQVGGNWCPWCIKLHDFIENHAELDSIVKADYILIRVNYSKENRNMNVMSDLDYPQRFGFPVLVVLDTHGNRIHTQNTAYLEEGSTYDEKKIKEFLLNWNRQAVDPARYD